jgi:DnaJ-class molecular chaperone
MPKSKTPLERGDMVVEVSVKYPKGPLLEEQKNALKDVFRINCIE